MNASFEHGVRFRTLLGQLIQAHADQVAALHSECRHLRHQLGPAAVADDSCNNEVVPWESFTPRTESLADHGQIHTSGRQGPRLQCVDQVAMPLQRSPEMSQDLLQTPSSLAPGPLDQSKSAALTSSSLAPGPLDQSKSTSLSKSDLIDARSPKSKSTSLRCLAQGPPDQSKSTSLSKSDLIDALSPKSKSTSLSSLAQEAPDQKKTTSFNTEPEVKRRSSTVTSNETDGKKQAAASRLSSLARYKLNAEWVMDDEEQDRIMEKHHKRTQVAVGTVASVSSRWEKENGSFLVLDGRCFHPESKARVLWDVMSMILLCYDAIFLPLQFFEFAMDDFTKVMDYIGASFWALDILASCATGTYVKGKLVMKVSTVALRYAKTWLSLDVVLVTLDWISTILGHQKYHQTYSVLRAVRIIRFLRLIRLVKITVFGKNMANRINSTYWLLVLKISKSMLTLVLTIHIICGFWYLLADTSDKKGWLHENRLETSSKWHQYLVSLHWATAIFHGSVDIYPTNPQERIFASIMILLGLISVSFLVGSVTNSMLKLETLRTERNQQYHMLCKYFSDRMISNDLCSQVKHYLEHHMVDRWQVEQRVTVLQQLPNELRMKLHEEARAPSLISNQFFYQVYAIWPRAGRHICHAAVGELTAATNTTIFSLGAACNRVLLVLRGEVMYYLNKDEDAQGQQWDQSQSQVAQSHYGRLFNSMRGMDSCTDSCNPPLQESIKNGVAISDSQWISEPVLWTKWECCGSLFAHTDSVLLAIDTSDFSQVVSQYEIVHLMATRYAHCFVNELNRGSHELSDLHTFSADSNFIASSMGAAGTERSEASTASQNYIKRVIFGAGSAGTTSITSSFQSSFARMFSWHV